MLPVPSRSQRLLHSTQRARMMLTCSLLLAVARDGTDDGILLAAETVHGALGVSLGLGGVVLCLALGVLVPARGGPGLGAGEVADRLDDGALDGVVLTGGLAARVTRAGSVRLSC